jgi:exodeoxyribonuclease VII large subunit
VYKDTKLLSSSDSLEKGDKVNITFGSGGAVAEITDKW